MNDNEVYKLGDMWSDNFDYDGMLKAGLKITLKTSIKKIADIASVGTATVDRVLNNRKGVKKSTKLKILDAIHFLENNIQLFFFQAFQSREIF